MNDFSIWVRKWWPGVLPLALIWAAAVWTTTVPIEQDLAAGAMTALKDTVLDKTQIEMSGRDVRFTADAFRKRAATARSRRSNPSPASGSCMTKPD